MYTFMTEQRLAMDKMVVERAVRDADLLGHLAQAQTFMAVLCHEASSGLQRFGPETSVSYLKGRGVPV